MIKGSGLYFSSESKRLAAKYLDDVLSSGRLVRDVQVESFESELCDKFGFPDITLVNSDTSSFDLLFSSQCLNVSNKKVGFLGNCFPSPIFSAIRAGAEIVWFDVDPRTLEVRLEDKDVDFFVVTSIGGMVPPNVDAIVKFCDDKSAFLIEDAAHSIGATRGDYSTGSWADISVFSFSATKRLTCGEGGGIVSDNSDLLKDIRCLARYGKATDFGDADCIKLGYSLRFNEIDAAIGRAMLTEFDAETNLRKSIAKVYIERLSSRNYLSLYDYSDSNWYKFPVFIIAEYFNYDFFASRLKELGVQLSARVYEIPAYKQKPLVSEPSLELTGTDLFCNNHICLPMWEGISVDDANLVCDALVEALEGVRH